MAGGVSESQDLNLAAPEPALPGYPAACLLLAACAGMRRLESAEAAPSELCVQTSSPRDGAESR